MWSVALSEKRRSYTKAANGLLQGEQIVDVSEELPQAGIVRQHLVRQPTRALEELPEDRRAAAQVGFAEIGLHLIELCRLLL